MQRGASGGIVNGMRTAIRTNIDAAGRIVIPKPIREAVGFSARDVVEVILLKSGAIELRPASRAIELTDADGVIVAVPLEAGEVLREETVTATRESVRREREPTSDG